MRLGKRGGIWKWVWILVVLGLLFFGLYYGVRWLTDSSRITGIGVNGLSLVLAQ